MKKLLFTLLLLPNVAHAQGLSQYGNWGAPAVKEYYPDTEVLPEINGWQTEMLPYQSDPPPWLLPPRAYTDPRPDDVETTPFLKVTPKYNNKPYIESIEPAVVEFPNQEQYGTILISTKRRILLYTLNNQQAYLYPIGVGRDGFTWSGQERISRIEYWPSWHPPKEMLARRPELPEHMEGGIKNPLGAVAMYLGNSMYRIHGTNDPKSIGKAESSGCFRMMNGHAVHLASIVSIGDLVKIYQ